ncbi:MAG: hypothetical protein CFE43_10055 [Burkholderiales bacterium PBB3]|nr:MAG: hypothetical protein CFE43_10055 [Burkholderiales bacterium PBB3]
MNEPQGKGKFAVSSGPVNRRTATPTQRTAPKTQAPVVLNRLKAAQAKHRLGSGLAQRLAPGASGGHTPARARMSLIVQSMGCTVSGVGLFVGAIQNAWPVIGVSAAALLGLGTWTWRSYRQQHASAAEVETKLAALIDPADLQRLDSVLEQVAKESGPTTVELLVQFKETLIRCVALASGQQSQGLLASEDSLFIRESVRRYVPDSLQAYLKVPQAERESRVIDDGKTASALLHAQIALIAEQLQQHEARLTQLAGEALLQQQRFLAAKTQSTRV